SAARRDGDQVAARRPGGRVVGGVLGCQPFDVATVGVHHMDGVPGAAGGAGRLARADEGQALTVGRPGGVVGEGEVVGQPPQPLAVEADGVQLQVAVALGDEGDGLAVGTEGSVVVEGGVVGEAAGGAGLAVEDVDVPAARRQGREGDGAGGAV